MKFFALEEWAAANAAYDAEVPPYRHAKIVPGAIDAVSGVLWSVSYILMARQGFKDKSYAMPIYCLCLNIAWETVFGFFYGPGLSNQIVFAQWMVVDMFLVYNTVKYGREQWKQSPLIANNLGWIIGAGCMLCLGLILSIAGTFVPLVGRKVVAFTGWPAQILLSIGSVAQLLSRGHTRGHSWGIWWTRSLGSLGAAICLYWRGYFWAERYDYVFTPFFVFLMLTYHLFELAYPVIFSKIRRREEAEMMKKRANGKAS